MIAPATRRSGIVASAALIFGGRPGTITLINSRPSSSVNILTRFESRQLLPSSADAVPVFRPIPGLADSRISIDRTMPVNLRLFTILPHLFFYLAGSRLPALQPTPNPSPNSAYEIHLRLCYKTIISHFLSLSMNSGLFLWKVSPELLRNDRVL